MRLEAAVRSAFSLCCLVAELATTRHHGALMASSVPYRDAMLASERGGVGPVSSLVGGLISTSSIRSCSLVVAHDYAGLLPESLQELARNVSLDYIPTVQLRLHPTDLLDASSPANGGDGQGGDAASVNNKDLWDASERRNRAGSCVLHMLTGRTLSSFREMVWFHAQRTAVQPWRDLFAIWIRSGPSDDGGAGGAGAGGQQQQQHGDGQHDGTTRALLLQETKGWKYKVGLQPSVGPDDGDEVSVSTVCFFCDRGGPRLVSLGTHRPGRAITVRSLFPDTTLDFGGRRLRSPFMESFDSQELSERAEMEGAWSLSNAELGVYTLARSLNFHWEVYEKGLTSTDLERSRLGNGSWVGYIGELITGEADFVPIYLYHPDAMTHVNMATPTMFSSFTFVTAKASPVWSWKTIIWPFQPLVWLCIGAGTGLGAVAGWYLLKRHPAGDHAHLPTWSVLSVGAYLAQSFLEQIPNRPVPASDPFRVFVAFWLYLAIVVTCGYQEMIFGFIAIPRREALPATFEELDRSGYGVGAQTLHGIAYALVLQDADLQALQSIKEKMVMHQTMEECFEAVLRHQHQQEKEESRRTSCLGIQLLMSVDVWKMVDWEGRFPFFDAAESAVNTFTGVLAHKDFVGFGTLEWTSVALLESGIGDRMRSNQIRLNSEVAIREDRIRRKRWGEEAGRCAGEDGQGGRQNNQGGEGDGDGDPRPLSAKKLYGPLGLICYGWLVSLAGFAGELALRAITRRMLRINNRISLQEGDHQGEEEERGDDGDNNKRGQGTCASTAGP